MSRTFRLRSYEALRSTSALLAVVCAAALISSCSQSAAGSNDAHPAPGTPDAIIAHYYRAIGGYDRLENITSRQMWGVYSEGKFSATTDMAWKRPAFRRVNVHAPGYDYSEGFDGLTWEYGFQSKKFIVDTGAAANAGRRGAEFDESFVDYARKGHKVDVVGAERFGERPAHRLRVTLTDGWEKEYLFDDSTGLILALRKAMPVHATGAPVTSVSVYEDWRPEGGVLQPHRFIERELRTDRLMTTLQWDSIRTNIELGARDIGRPAH
ncbi:MAG: hypothetical protein M3Y30_08265 [Gemmatimonadota bacterium]|nr:hypothetical protein [Gemmatimonadota bacterium]